MKTLAYQNPIQNLYFELYRQHQNLTPQTELPRDQRRKNVRGAFRTGEAFANRRIAIIDDVMTSGHTANALAACSNNIP